MFLKKYIKSIIFISLWILIILNAITSEIEFSETVDIKRNVLEKMILFRSLLFILYIIFVFLFRKTMSEFFLIINTILWFFMSLPPILSSNLIYKNILIFDRISLFFNICIVIFIYSVYIKTFNNRKLNHS